MKNLVGRLVKEEEGQGMVEYGLIVALVVVVGLAVVGSGSSGNLGTAISKIFGKITAAIDTISF